MGVYGFLHFTINTFTDREWGLGDEDPNLFQPTAFDADAILEAMKAGGMTGAILTCKHHDGFCLWPTRTTEHSVRASTWRGGKGDVVKEISEAARRHGMKFGVYLSPWDRNHAQYGRPEYIKVYRQQLRELLTEYGPIFEVWHDGANGGDGYYGGAREKRLIDKRSYYDWPGTWELVRSLQPDAVIFSDVGPDIRWVGNERGYANDPCWETYDPVGEDGGPASPGDVRARESTTGTRNGSRWLPPECDVSIRPGWFWHERENSRVKTAAQLMDLYYRSVGRGANLLLNVPPDRRGLVHDTDAAVLREFGERVRGTFAKNLAAGAKAVPSGSEVELRFQRAVTFDVIRVREQIALGQRVEAFAIDADGAAIAEGTSIGNCRLIRLEKAVTAGRVTLRVTKAGAAPVIAELGVYREGG
jgi:alpha-L-fucosidase